ncbi:MAG: CDP-2,3-bis-(O-geranylgeranyl)-sn-glycerol synthase [Candidatus Hodarchaeota archaeon]
MVELITLIIESIIFIFPAFVSNASPVFLGRGKRFNAPIDGGKVWKDGRRVLGNGKTIRGFIGGTICGMIVSVAILILVSQISYSFSFMTSLEQGLLYTILEPLGITFWTNKVLLGLIIGFLLGCGSLIGDLTGSFIKRRYGLQRGESFPLMDQLGFLFMALIFVYPVIPWPFYWLVFLIPITLTLHILLNLGSYFVGFQDVPF